MHLTPIGTIHTPYKEKFAVPRQPNLVQGVSGKIQLLDKANDIEAVRGLEQFSHVWLLFLFDQNIEAGWKPTVRPPRLGGNERIGVFASRSTFRPNGIGMSAVPLNNIYQHNGQVWIDVGGVDLVDQTPIIDIKPYIPYSDSISEASGGFASDAPKLSAVIFSEQAQRQLKSHPEHQRVIEQVLAQDPRPAYKKAQLDDKIYAVHLFDYNVRFKAIDQAQIEVIDIEPSLYTQIT